MKRYILPFVSNGADWRNAMRGASSLPIRIENLPWGDVSGVAYRPRSEAALAWGEDAFHLVLRSYDSAIRARERQRNHPVCLDSCLEFFFSPVPELLPSGGLRYFNIECNPAGTLWIGYSSGGGRETSASQPDAPSNRVLEMQALSDAEIAAYRGPFWQVSYRVPYEYLRRLEPTFHPSAGWIMRGNFYKCGEQTEHSHFMVWSEIHTPQPDYHRPEYFGELVLGER